MKILHSDNFVRQSRTRDSGSRVTFRLRPYGRVRGFVCSLDGRKFRRCRSPLRIYAKVGPHLLRARAIGVTGLKGPVATDLFAIRRPNSARARPFLPNRDLVALKLAGSCDPQRGADRANDRSGLARRAAKSARR